MTLVIVYIVCGILAYGASFAHLQYNWPYVAEESYKRDMCISILHGLLGPASLIVLLFFTSFFKYGFKFK